MAILNVYAANIRASKYMKQRWTDFDEEKHKIIVEDFNTALSITDRSRQKISEDVE